MDEKPTFNVAIIYEDNAAGRRAKHFYDKVIRELVDECNFSLKLWNFRYSQFRRLGIRPRMSPPKQTSSFFQCTAKLSFPAQTRRWIERWSRLIADRKPALVALLDQPETRRGTVDSTLGYLRNVADRKGISFYAHTTFCLSKN